ncbi:MAG: carboxypeptidase-like regulatory domain-containing protein [Planctomycetota bacterium]
MRPKVALAGLALACGASLVWFLLQPEGNGPEEAIRPLAAAPPAPAARGAELAAGAAAAGGAEGAAAPTRTAAAAPAPASRERWRGELAGVAGRLAEVDGTPAPGLAVVLLELDARQLLAGDWERLGEAPPDLALDATRSDGEGRFVLDGARDGSFHALGIDLGGARATLRVIDQALHHRERTDLGDVVLAAYGVLVGRVVDPDGRPLAGARVRVAEVPEEVAATGIYEWRKETILSVGGREVVELPARLGRYADLLPVPTAYTGADGAFRLAGVPLTRVVGGVDRAGWAGIPIAPTEVAGGEQSLGELVLSRGRTIRGVVADTTGAPIAGVEVFAGALHEELGIGFLQPAGPTDGEGRFSLSGAPVAGPLVAVARHAPWEEWVSLAPPEEAGELRLVLPAAAPLTVRVRDEAGAPLPGARLGVRPMGPAEASSDVSSILSFVRGGALPAPAFHETEPGTLVCGALAPGTYEVEARVAGLAPGTARVMHAPEGTEVALTCAAGRSILVHVSDEATGEPVARARASVMQGGAPLVASPAVAWTDREGRATLGPFSAEAPEDGEGGGPWSGEPAVVLVEHPRYADRVVRLEEGASALEIAMASGGTLHGRIHCGGAPPTRSYMVILEYRDADGLEAILHVPRFARSDLAGSFRLSNLPAGEHRAEVYERFLAGDPLPFLRDEEEPVRVFAAEVEIRPGETAELEVDLTPTGMGPTGRILGTVRVDGRAVAGAEVRIWGNQRVELATDERGAFDTGEISVLDGLSIRIAGEVDVPGAGPRRRELHVEHVELEPGDVHEVALDLHSREVLVQVVEAGSGAPLEGARLDVTARGGRPYGNHPQMFLTDAAGEARVLLVQEGAHDLVISHADHLNLHGELEVPSDVPSRPRRYELGHAVPCAGRIVASGADRGEPRWVYLQIHGEGGSEAGESLDPENLAFDLPGLGPGAYRAQIWLDGQRGEEVPFELGPAGTRDLVLTFTPAEDR